VLWLVVGRSLLWLFGLFVLAMVAVGLALCWLVSGRRLVGLVVTVLGLWDCFFGSARLPFGWLVEVVCRNSLLFWCWVLFR